MIKTTKRSNLFYLGHVYEDRGEYPCPIKGCEDGLVKTTFQGQPAWWDEGHIFVLISTTDVHPAADWARKMKPVASPWSRLLEWFKTARKQPKAAR